MNRLESWLRTLGPAGIIGIGVLMACALFYFSGLRPAEKEPATRPLDPRIEVAGSAPFDGIAGYLRHAPWMLRANRPILRRAIRDADLVWIRVPGSNASESPLASCIMSSTVRNRARDDLKNSSLK